MSKLTALVFRSLVITSLFGSAVACTAEIQIPEGLGSKTSDALGGKKGHGTDGGASGSDASAPDSGESDGGIVVMPDSGIATDSGIYDDGDASVWGDDDDSSSDGGTEEGYDASARR